ncbi:MAG: hypothetical protein WCP73_09805 [Eubacteriales bacterium]
MDDCKACGIGMRITDSGWAIEGDNSPNTDTKLYSTFTLECVNPNCSQCGVKIEHKNLVLLKTVQTEPESAPEVETQPKEAPEEAPAETQPITETPDSTPEVEAATDNTENA